MFSRLFSHLAIFLLWLLHFLPRPVLVVLGCGLGRLFYRLGRRRRIVETNLKLCFPEQSDVQRTALAKAHFRVLGCSLLERSLLWWGRPECLRKLIRVEGEEKIHHLLQAGKPVILLGPHFVGLDAGGIALGLRFDALTMYSKQSNEVFDELIYRSRKRFGDQILLSRQDGILATIKAMRAGRPFYYLPDMDFGHRDAVFVPFFGIPAATVTGLSRLARVVKATVMLTVTRRLPGSQGYVLEIGNPWPDFPTDDVEADTRRMNEHIEAFVRSMPEQYYWVHRRFKTRPEGEQLFY